MYGFEKDWKKNQIQILNFEKHIFILLKSRWRRIHWCFPLVTKQVFTAVAVNFAIAVIISVTKFRRSWEQTYRSKKCTFIFDGNIGLSRNYSRLAIILSSSVQWESTWIDFLSPIEATIVDRIHRCFFDHCALSSFLQSSLSTFPISQCRACSSKSFVEEIPFWEELFRPPPIHEWQSR